MSHISIAVIGGINMDIVMETDRMPALGESISGTSLAKYPGGKGANTAVAAYRASHRKSSTIYRWGGATGTSDNHVAKETNLVAAQPHGYDETNDIHIYLNGAVGSDEFGTVLLDKLSKNGVNVSQVQIISDEESATAIVIVETQSGESRSIAYHGATRKWQFREQQQQQQQQQQPGNSIACMTGGASKPDLIICHLSIPLAEVIRVLRAATSEGVRTLLNPSPATHLAAEVYQYVTHLILNETEMAMLCQRRCGQSQHDLTAWAEASTFFLGLGVENVIITLGSKGAYYATSTGYRGVIEAEKNVKVVDSTGAGDTFVGTYAVEYVQQKRGGTWTIQKAIQRACKAAARTIEHIGAQESIPWADEVDALP